MIHRALNLINNPMQLATYIGTLLNKDFLFKRYSNLSSDLGIKRLYFILSFDCDTEDDIKVVSKVHERLENMGVLPVYAVPGELLLKGEKEYRRIAESGSEFINHGYREHVFFDNLTNRYKSNFFYNQIPEELIKEDIVNGDNVLSDFLGLKIQGFRVPHFGHYQKNKQLKLIHTILKELGYKYSTSTVPLYGFIYGPIFSKFGLVEIPVSGMWSNPLRILDSYSFFYSQSKKFKTSYYYESDSIRTYFEEKGLVGILNYYADPSHIANNDLFFKTIEHLTKVSYSISYEKLIEELALK
ncbi:MAG: polysaccharide deacetylase family protein [Clostridia bacterium]|nr:polysaccharide deacetylase family protein [Clostridia bacterium]